MGFTKTDRHPFCNQEVIQELLRETSDFKMKLEPPAGHPKMGLKKQGGHWITYIGGMLKNLWSSPWGELPETQFALDLGCFFNDHL